MRAAAPPEGEATAPHRTTLIGMEERVREAFPIYRHRLCHI
jgi:hypothetical protein